MVSCPFGLINLDILMLLEPFGLLTVLPLRVVKALRAGVTSRIIMQVIEPSCGLQSFFAVVMHRVRRSHGLNQTFLEYKALTSCFCHDPSWDLP